jgi:tyrosyl-DNA phosphodiesterase 2
VRSRRGNVSIGAYDESTSRWTPANGKGAVDRDVLTVATYNIWFNDLFAERRYRAIADVLSRESPDVMVFQEVTPTALEVFLAQPWIRDGYRRAAVTGDDVGNYGMLLLTRLPIQRVTYTRLPTRLARGFLTAEFTINGRPQVICAVHLESGKRATRVRARQLRTVFRALRGTDDALVLGDFNMRDSENDLIDPAYRDLWPTLRPKEPGYTEDTSINLMRYDMKDKHRHVRFDRVLLKGAGWSGAGIELLGKEPISADLPRVFPSDHFGVACSLERRSPVPADTGHRRKSWRRRHQA